MIRYFKSALFIIFSVVFSYIGLSFSSDPAEIISKYDIPKDFVIREITINESEKILVKAGNEKFGLNHILKRHSTDHFKEEQNKGKLFPEGTNGQQIINAIEDVYNMGQIESKNKNNKSVYNHELIMNGELGKYRLVINNNNEVITFYKIKT